DEKEPADESPKWEPGRRERADRSTPRKSPECELGHQRRHADHHGHEDIEQHERGAAELSDHVGKAPDVPEADGDADDRHQRAEARREWLSAFGHLPAITEASTSSAVSTSAIVL